MPPSFSAAWFLAASLPVTPVPTAADEDGVRGVVVVYDAGTTGDGLVSADAPCAGAVSLVDSLLRIARHGASSAANRFAGEVGCVRSVVAGGKVLPGAVPAAGVVDGAVAAGAVRL
jgi:hypothetical protein